MDSCANKQIQLDQLMPLIKERLAAGHTVRFSPRGTSMRPLLRQGKDDVILAPLPAVLKKYDLPLYQRNNGQYVLHRIVKVGPTYTCIGDNQFQLETGLRQDQMIGVVTAFTREQKLHSVSELGYKLYCRIWHMSRPVRHICYRGMCWLRRRKK